MRLLRLFASLHGVIGVLAVAALIHPAIHLGRGRTLGRPARVGTLVAALLTIMAFAGGLLLYPAYNRDVRAALFHIDSRAGWLFEAKEHFAFFAVCLAVGSSLAAWFAPAHEPALRRAAGAGCALAALFAIGATLLGYYIASVHTF